MAVFVRVVDAGGFSAAARQLGMTPSAVSRQVARLEAELTIRLLERTTRKLRLSEPGAEVYRRAQEMVAAAREAMAAAGKFTEAPSGLIRISVPKAFGRLVLHPLIPAFLHRYPSIDVQLVVSDRYVDLIDDEVDLAIRITDQPAIGLAARPLMPVRHVLCASRQYLLTHGMPAHPRELAQHSCLYLGEHAGDNRWQFRRRGEQVQVMVHGRYVANHSEIRLEGVLQHLGIGCLPHFTADNALQRGEVVEVLPGWEFMGAYRGTAWVLYPPNRYLSAKLRVFIDYLADELAPRRAVKAGSPRTEHK
ncbi:LysR family transcriptional regulator [Chitiniphilus purpureus]|uniref:LysR family transcriptional regulator n=1 Tax=Chitiniphilus purpureus TaxID=2981137 RepID=A0ABY6DP04_9NEIS|nr:LysR family transcriptional regulator [Chitiniphilus sp. CD1]UXY16119.1 LysR family transcriptional regulator [Chitiniphilus sp. CD1]